VEYSALLLMLSYLIDPGHHQSYIFEEDLGTLTKLVNLLGHFTDIPLLMGYVLKDGVSREDCDEGSKEVGKPKYVDQHIIFPGVQVELTVLHTSKEYTY
jgi:hypothetical protein